MNGGIPKYAARRDGNEHDIVQYLESRGALVLRVSMRGVPDLLVGWAGRWHLVEVKSPSGTYTDDQVEFRGICFDKGLPLYTVRSTMEARALLDSL